MKMNRLSDDNLTGEGGILIHGKAILKNFDRGDLFSQELDRKLTSIVCNVCLTPSRDLVTWRQHCINKHSTLPGYKVTQLSTGVSPSPHLFSPSSGRFPCPKCKRRFHTQDQVDDHRHSQMRCVRLVCGQCQGLWSDLESHVTSEHVADDTCNKCGQTGLTSILDHYHEVHDGFASVIAETEIKCAGDGVTAEWFETVLATTARFLATEVKPEKDPDDDQDKFVDILDTSVLYNNISDISVPKIVSVSSNAKTSSPTNNRIRAGRQCNIGITTEEERNAYNVQCFLKLKSTPAPGYQVSRNNDCDICGFQPYTKNKYREKQDHLTKNHFKERIERLLPLTSPYRCPDTTCDYLGKDKQDIQRHYTGKHNILKMWVEEFLKEQADNLASGGGHVSAGVPGSGPELTFRQMEQIAIQQDQSESSIVSRDTVLTNQRAVLSQDTSVTITKTEPVEISSLNSSIDLSKSCLSISKVSKTNKSPARQIETPPSISLIRISKSSLSSSTPTLSNSASSLLESITAASKSSKSPVKSSLGFKFPCSNCDMSFPTQSARCLHQEVCQTPSKVTVLDPPSPIAHDNSEDIDDPTDETDEPPVKKKRPPPPLIPLK